MDTYNLSKAEPQGVSRYIKELGVFQDMLKIFISDIMNVMEEITGVFHLTGFIFLHSTIVFIYLSISTLKD